MRWSEFYVFIFPSEISVALVWSGNDVEEVRDTERKRKKEERKKFIHNISFLMKTVGIKRRPD